MNSGRLFAVVFITVFLGMMVYSCSEQRVSIIGRAYTGLLFGKEYVIDVVGDSTDYQVGVDSIISIFHANFDVNNPESVIARYNQYQCRDSAFVIFDSTRVFGIAYDLTRDLHLHTLRYYDPTVAPLKREWMVAKMRGDIEPNLDSLFEFVGFDPVKIDLTEVEEQHVYQKSYMRKADKRIELDFTDLAKAMALDHIGDFFRSKGVDQFRIKYGRDVITFGFAVDSLNILSMGVSSDSQDINIRMTNAAFSYTNAQDKVAMVDPTYGYPVINEMAYVGVVAPTLVEAKIFAQTFIIMGLEKASEYYSGNEDSRIHSYMFYTEGDVLHSASTNGFDALIIGTGNVENN